MHFNSYMQGDVANEIKTPRRLTIIPLWNLLRKLPWSASLEAVAFPWANANSSWTQHGIIWRKAMMLKIKDVVSHLSISNLSIDKRILQIDCESQKWNEFYKRCQTLSPSGAICPLPVAKFAAALAIALCASFYCKTPTWQNVETWNWKNSHLCGIIRSCSRDQQKSQEPHDWQGRLNDAKGASAES